MSMWVRIPLEAQRRILFKINVSTKIYKNKAGKYDN